MLGAAVYRLSSKNTAQIPLVHGRLMHAAFFSLLEGIDPALSAYVHDTQQQKAFTVSELFGLPETARRKTGLLVNSDTQFFWRVTAWNNLLTQSIQAISPGTELRIGSLNLVIQACLLSPEEHREAGFLTEEYLMAACFSVPSVQEITFSFRSPVSFRCFDRDFPWPQPEYIFGSLIDKWAMTDCPLSVDRPAVYALSQNLLPRRWHGRSHTVYLKKDRGTLAFDGEFTYGTAHLSTEEQQLLLLLAQFSVFSGVGRLTGHGLGQTRVRYR